jgi:hypothetical protein
MRISNGRGAMYTEYTNQAAGVRSLATISMFFLPKAVPELPFEDLDTV